MVWLAILGLISLALIFAGYNLAARRIRRYRQETETRRARAFAEMKKIAEEQNAERTLRQSSGQGMQNAE